MYRIINLVYYTQDNVTVHKYCWIFVCVCVCLLCVCVCFKCTCTSMNAYTQLLLRFIPSGIVSKWSGVDCCNEAIVTGPLLQLVYLSSSLASPVSSSSLVLPILFLSLQLVSVVQLVLVDSEWHDDFKMTSMQALMASILEPNGGEGEGNMKREERREKRKKY